MFISPNQVGVYFMLYQIEPRRGLAAHKKSLTCSFFVRYFIVTRFGTSQVGFSSRRCRCRSDVTVENVSETSLAEMDRRQHCDVASQHLIDNSWVCVCSRVYPCLCVSVSEWHTWKANFLPKQKKNTYRRKIHWHVEVDRVSLSMCVCARIFCGFSWSTFPSGVCCSPATNIGKFLWGFWHKGEKPLPATFDDFPRTLSPSLAHRESVALPLPLPLSASTISPSLVASLSLLLSLLCSLAVLTIIFQIVASRLQQPPDARSTPLRKSDEKCFMAKHPSSSSSRSSRAAAARLPLPLSMSLLGLSASSVAASLNTFDFLEEKHFPTACVCVCSTLCLGCMCVRVWVCLCS